MKKIFLICVLTLIAGQFVFAIPHFSVANKGATNLVTVRRSVENKDATNLAIWGGDWRSVEDKKPTNLGAVYNRFSVENKDATNLGGAIYNPGGYSVENKDATNLGGAIYNPGGYSVENKDATDLVTVRRSVDKKDATDLAVFPLMAPIFSSENKDAKELNEETENRIKGILLKTSAPEVEHSFLDKCKELVIIIIG